MMKKWLSLYIVLCAVLLCICGGVWGSAAAKDAFFGAVQSEGGHSSQAVRREEHSYVLYQNPEQKKFQIVKTDKKITDFETLATAHKNGVYQLYSYTERGEHRFGVEPLGLAKGEEEWQPTEFAADGKMLAFGSGEYGLLLSVLGEDGRTVTEYYFLLESRSWIEWQSYQLPDGHFPVVSGYDAGELWMAMEDGSVYCMTQILREQDVSFAETFLADRLHGGIAAGAETTWKFYQMRAAALEMLIPVLAAAAAVTLLIYALRRWNHMICRMLCCTEVLCCVVLLGTGYFVAERMTEQRVLEIGVEAGSVLEVMKGEQRGNGTVDSTTYWNVMQEKEGILMDMIVAEPEQAEVILSGKLPAGTAAGAYYGEEMQSLAVEAAAANNAVMTKLQKIPAYAVALRDWTDMTPDSVLMAVVAENDIQKGIEEQLDHLRMMIGGMLLLATVVHLVLFRICGGRWQKLVTGASYIATEKGAFPEVPKQNDGLQSVWEPLDCIGKDLTRLYYEREKFYRSYYRFVPKDMETLMRRPELADIEIGDRNRLHGCIVHFLLEDMKQLDSGTYMDTITKSMEWMHRIRKQKDGFYLSGSTDLLEQKLFFGQSADDALQFSIELLQHLVVEEQLADKELLLMVHAGEFQYGFSGVKDMVTPYMYSTQESILVPYAKSLAKAKVRLVLTEQTAKLISPQYSLRYIGFISGGDTLGSLKLYECLDAYEGKQRKRMLETDVMFQRGLQLFYSNDFYLARNTFNEVLKLNEADHIARWYLFHCEYHLNRPEAEVSYGLFENIVLEQQYDRV